MKSIPQLLSAVTLAALSATASAGSAIYDSAAAFLAQLQSGAYSENFNGLDTTPPSAFSNGIYSYTVSAPSDLYGSGEFLATSQIDEALTISFTSGNVKAVGGNFFATNISDAFQAVSITILLSDGSTTTFTPATLSDSYRGFVADTFITSLVISRPGPSLYAAMDNLSVGTVITTVPEPQPATLALAGLAVLGLAAARRRALERA
jgi:MYXO-CTERM domain-containing protein